MSAENKWSSSFGFVLASIGAAVGLGNIWRFPYLVGESGGGAFVLVYLAFIFCIGVPILIAEIMLGRHAKTNLIDGLEKIAIENKKPRSIRVAGWFSLVTLFMILVFYSVVSGWVLFYLKESTFFGIPHARPQLEALWSSLIKDYKVQIFYYSIFNFLTFYVLGKGVQHGLERLNAVLMPVLFLLLILLVTYSATMSDGFYKTAQFLFSFDFSKLTSKAIIQALGQAFFSMAVGGGAMFVYGSYLSEKVSIAKSAIYIALAQFSVGILAGFAIFPIIFTKNLTLEFGPGLIFVTVPHAFAGVIMSNLICASFFYLLLFAAITSSINLGEPLVSTLSSKTSLSRKAASAAIFALSMIIGITVILSLNIFSEYKIFNYNLFEGIVHLSTNIMLPLGGIFYAVCAGFILQKHISKKELGLKVGLYNIWYYSVKYIIPIALVTLLLSTN